MATENNKQVLNAPTLRFPEFTDEWKEEELSQIADISKGEGISKDQLSEEGEPCILYGELYTKYKSEIINEIFSKTNIDSSGLKRSKANDVIIPCSGETAIDIATARCVPFDNVLLGGDLNIISPHQHNGAFMSYQLNGKRKYDIAKVAQGVSVVHLYGDHLNTIITYNPKINEQRKITKLLSLIDKRIATQSEAIEDLKVLRRTAIERHYAKASKGIARIRDLGEPFSVMNLSKEDLCDGGDMCIIYGELFTTYGCVINNVKSRTEKTESATRSKRGDLVFPASTTVDALSLISPSSINIDGVVLGGDMFGIHTNPDYNSEYLSYFFNFIEGKTLAKYAQGSTIIHLHYGDIKDVEIALPTKMEQDELVNVMRIVEKKISVEERLVELYVLMKKYFLQNMFI